MTIGRFQWLVLKLLATPLKALKVILNARRLRQILRSDMPAEKGVFSADAHTCERRDQLGKVEAAVSELLAAE